DDLVGADGSAAVDIGEAEAGRRQGLEAEPGQQPRRAGIPRVGDDEGARLVMQRAECRRLFRLGAHRPLSLSLIERGRSSGLQLGYVQCIISTISISFPDSSWTSTRSTHS